MKYLQEYPKSLEGSKSLLAKYLSKEVFEELKDKVTSNGFTLTQVINSGVQNPDSGIGAYVGDEESYEVFASLFDPIIEEYHGFKKEDKHKSNLNSNDLNAPNPDPTGEYILSTRIRVGRNVKNIPLGPAINDEQRDAIEKEVSEVLSSFENNLGGKYYPLNNMSEENTKSLIQDHFLFKAGDRFLETAGLNRNWPNGRGIFHNNEKTFLVWINEEDELRIISMQQGGNIKEVFVRLVTAINTLSQKFEFAYNDHLGYITSCPTNLGTAMRASVHIKLPNLGDKMDEFKIIADKYHVQIRGVHGEHSQSEGGIYDISNKRRLGVSEVECVQDMYDGVVALIKREKELSKI
ncbi:phosphagen kinase [Sulfurimonas sp.]|uniref:phosphagen kinase n=1 Tax=Sulfurimonas sp. TaxID=2022749 RepID=UPI002B497FD2|nr:phosphagen kinase [Sulfurimonas sp.]